MRAQVAATVTPFVLNLRDWMPGLRSTWESVQHLAEFVRRWVPNWSSDLDIEKAWEITGDGIPLAFVPRARIVEEIVDAADHVSRIAILIRLKGLVVADCRAALVPEEDDPFPESIAMLPSLLSEAIDVLEAGYFAAACVLGIAVIDSVRKRTMPSFSYKKLREEAIKAGLEEAIEKNDFRISLSRRPLLYEWWGEGDPVPMMPSRHVVAHWAHPEHLTEADAIIIVMAATSLMLGLAERKAIAQLVANESA
jgi:hypothetical protein